MQQFPALRCPQAACHVPHVIRFGNELDSCTHKSIWFQLELKHLGPVSLSQSCDLSAFSLRIFTLLDFYAHVRQTTAWWKQKEVPQDVPLAIPTSTTPRAQSSPPHQAHHFYSVHNIAGGLPTWPRNCRKSTLRSTLSTWPSVFINEY